MNVFLYLVLGYKLLDIHLLNTEIPAVKLIETVRYVDERGYFMESFHKEAFEKEGIPADYVQDNHSTSRKGVIRGIHYQDMSAPLSKLVRCISGEVLDVAVDLRVGSPTFGKHVKQILSDENNLLLFIPVGFGHAFLTLSESATVNYKCTGYYSRSAEGTVRWNDPDLNIDWGIQNPFTSEKDNSAQTLEEYLKNPAFEQ